MGAKKQRKIKSMRRIELLFIIVSTLFTSFFYGCQNENADKLKHYFAFRWIKDGK